MNTLYWQYETSISPYIAISIRGDCRLSRKIYDDYLNTFIKLYNKIYVEKDETVVLYPYHNLDISQYCTIVKLNRTNDKIHYPQYNLLKDVKQ